MRNEVRSNVVINIIRTVTMMILSFVTFPVVCRILGDQMVGLYSWAVAFVYYFLVLARISIPNIAVRECIKVRNDPVKLTTKMHEFFIIPEPVAATPLSASKVKLSVIASVDGHAASTVMSKRAVTSPFTPTVPSSMVGEAIVT